MKGGRGSDGEPRTRSESFNGSRLKHPAGSALIEEDGRQGRKIDHKGTEAARLHN